MTTCFVVKLTANYCVILCCCVRVRQKERETRGGAVSASSNSKPQMALTHDNLGTTRNHYKGGEK